VGPFCVRTFTSRSSCPFEIIITFHWSRVLKVVEFSPRPLFFFYRSRTIAQGFPRLFARLSLDSPCASIEKPSPSLLFVFEGFLFFGLATIFLFQSPPAKDFHVPHGDLLSQSFSFFFFERTVERAGVYLSPGPMLYFLSWKLFFFFVVRHWTRYFSWPLTMDLTLWFFPFFFPALTFILFSPSPFFSCIRSLVQSLPLCRVVIFFPLLFFPLDFDALSFFFVFPSQPPPACCW